MLFNSQIFLLMFLPTILSIYWIGVRWLQDNNLFAKLVLLAGSWVFYAYWDLRLLPLLLASITINYFLVRIIINVRAFAKFALYLGISVNLLILGFFKYFGFFADSISYVTGWVKPDIEIALPLAISFFTFQQISCLVDEYRGKQTPHSLIDYALFISFFPQLIAGPIVRHHQLIPQIQTLPIRTGIAPQLVSGIMLITIGLIKKVALADTVALMTNPIFDASLTKPIATDQALMAVAGFSLQIYYDFSGYSDVAIGLALLFGIVLPINFNAPYKATSLIEFWRRWHITLSTFLRDYLYIALGGNRHGLSVMLFALLTTMLLGGLWHGAAWNFVIWGGLHGVGLIVNHLWRRSGLTMPELLGWVLTLSFVILTFSVFRAENLTSIMHLFWWLIPGFNAETLFETDISSEVYAALLVGWATALFGVSSHKLVQVPHIRGPEFAGIFAIVLLLLALQLGGQLEQEFIYFQF